jgi:phosphonate transport system substrate-binding protein
MPTSYATVVEAMIGKWVDVAVHGPYSYVIANSKDPDIQVFATYAKKPGYIQEEGPGYKAALITKKGSKFTSIDTLKGATIGLTDPASTSGNLVPRVVFTKEIDMPLEKYFSKVIYTGGHDLSTMAVYEGKVDAAFVATHRFDNVIERGMVKKEDFNYLWFSPVIPQDPFTYRGSLCPELKKNIEETFLTLHEQPAAAAFLKNVNSNKFVKMTSADYDVIRELKKAKDARKKKQ